MSKLRQRKMDKEPSIETIEVVSPVKKTVSFGETSCVDEDTEEKRIERYIVR